jgi:cytochrome c-type biogenesis protein CcmE
MNMKHGRFMVGLVGVAAVVSYLIWTGVSQTMVYYLTPSELLARVEADPSFRDVGVKVSGKVVQGSYERVPGPVLIQRFRVEDLQHPSVTFPVEYRDDLPETFTDHSDVVLEGRLGKDGVFQATTLLTKCGSRYEATPEELRK